MKESRRAAELTAAFTRSRERGRQGPDVLAPSSSPSPLPLGPGVTDRRFVYPSPSSSHAEALITPRVMVLGGAGFEVEPL